MDIPTYILPSNFFPLEYWPEVLIQGADDGYGLDRNLICQINNEILENLTPCAE